MRNHHIFLLLWLALWFWPGASAEAGEREGASPPPSSTHNEYHNSTIYNGDVHISNTAPGSDGFAGSWREPETGDIITSVIAPRRPSPQEQSAPLMVAPQLYPGGGQSPCPPRPHPGPRPGFQPGWPDVTPPGGSSPGWRPPHPSGPPPRPYPGPQPGFLPGWQTPVPSTGTGSMGNAASAIRGAGGR